MTLTEARRRIEWRLINDAIVVDKMGNVVYNAMQMDDPIIREKYNDDTYVLRSSRTGRLIVPPYRVNHETGDWEPVGDWEEP